METKRNIKAEFVSFVETHAKQYTLRQAWEIFNSQYGTSIALETARGYRKSFNLGQYFLCDKRGVKRMPLRENGIIPVRVDKTGKKRAAIPQDILRRMQADSIEWKFVNNSFVATPKP